MAAHIIPFPSQTPDVVWFSGGSLHARYGAHVRHMDEAQAVSFRDFWGEKATRLGHLPTLPEARLATRRWQEFTTALDRLHEHNRAVGKPSPYASERGEITFKASKFDWPAVPYDRAEDLEAALATRAMERQS